MKLRVPWPTGRADDILQRAVLLLLSLTMAGLVGLAIVAFVSSQDAAKQALDTRDQTAASASRRIDQLQADLKLARAELELAKSQRAELIAKVDALSMQLTALGQRPIVVSDSSGQVTIPRSAAPTTAGTTTTTAQPVTTTTTAPPAPQPNPQPAPEPPPERPFPCRTVFVPILCADTPATTRKARS